MEILHVQQEKARSRHPFTPPLLRQGKSQDKVSQKNFSPYFGQIFGVKNGFETPDLAICEMVERRHTLDWVNETCKWSKFKRA